MSAETESKWGADDTIGAMNYIVKDKLPSLLKGVETGKIYDLSQVTGVGAPQLAPFMPPYVQSMFCTADNTRRLIHDAMGVTDGVGILLERVEMTMHVGTHIDALGHCAVGDKMYNGNCVADCAGDWGLHKLGIEDCPPIVTRGVVIDVAGYKEVEHLGGGEVIGPGDLEAALAKQESEIREGDVVLVRTGWSKYYMVDNDTYVGAEPGLGLEAARWLSDQKVVAIGSDNMGVEVLPGEDITRGFPVHQHLIVEQGVYIIENMQLDEPCADKRYDFPFIVLPMKYKGATASPVRPIAIV